MQGRLSPVTKGKIQEFPWKNWRQEFQLANKLGFSIMEWTLDQEKLYENPLMIENGRQEIKRLCQEFNIRIFSLTGDCFMQSPFWKKSGSEKNRLQDVKKVVDYLKLKNIKQAESHLKDFRPWGWFETLKLDKCFQVKRIFVKPGAAISLQSHKYRSEHWIVVEGVAKVTIDDDIKFVNVGQSVYVPKGAIHRMENPGESSMVLIEVQIGNYLGEDDIVRYEDLYSRQ